MDPNPPTIFEIEAWKQKIAHLTREECATLYRFAPTGHPVFSCELPLYALFVDRYRSLGGMDAELSRKIGWEPKGVPTIPLP
jgi:hypothetical protein